MSDNGDHLVICGARRGVMDSRKERERREIREMATEQRLGQSGLARIHRGGDDV